MNSDLLKKSEQEYERTRRMRQEIREMLAEIRQTQFIKGLLFGVLPTVASFIIVYYLVALLLNR